MAIFIVALLPFSSLLPLYPLVVQAELAMAVALMVAGLAGCFVPVLPGPPLAWLGVLYYGWQTGWTQVSPWLVGALLVVAMIGATADWWMGFLGAKKGGASAWSQVAALAGGLIGLVVFSLPGMLIGSIAAIALVEWHRAREWKSVVRASGGYLAGFLLAMVVELVCTLLIIGVFAARVML